MIVLGYLKIQEGYLAILSSGMEVYCKDTWTNEVERSVSYELHSRSGY